MCTIPGISSVAGMNIIKSLPWPLIVGLGALALLRPLVNVVTHQLGVSSLPAIAIIITLAISVVWIAVVGLSTTVHPVLTLLFAGLTYGVLSLVLSGVLSPILTGHLQGPLAMPIAIIPALLTNAVWGLATGGLALLVQRLRGYTPSADRRAASGPGSILGERAEPGEYREPGGRLEPGGRQEPGGRAQ